MGIPGDDKFVLTLDGEDAQINPFIDEFDDTIKKIYEENKIIVLKLPASCSANSHLCLCRILHLSLVENIAHQIC